MYKGKLLITTILNNNWTDIQLILSKTDIKLFVKTSYPCVNPSLNTKKKDMLEHNVLLSTILYSTINKITIETENKSISIDVKLSTMNIIGYYLLSFQELSNLEFKILLNQLMDNSKNIVFQYRTKEQENKNELSISHQFINYSLSG